MKMRVWKQLAFTEPNNLYRVQMVRYIWLNYKLWYKRQRYLLRPG